MCGLNSNSDKTESDCDLADNFIADKVFFSPSLLLPEAA